MLLGVFVMLCHLLEGEGVGMWNLDWSHTAGGESCGNWLRVSNIDADDDEYIKKFRTMKKDRQIGAG